ncbi:hypothetical protein ACHQM5_025187 [Ranunculus cassubicifolius]
MTERVRRRTSKWDLPEEPDAFANGSWENNASHGKGSESIYDSGSKQNRNSARNTANRNTDSAYKSEGDRRSQWDTPSGNRVEYKDDYVSRDFTDVPRNSRTWDGNRSYSRSLSPPGRDDWRHRSRSRSPKRSWSKSHRSRSRSPPYRSRSRSPPYGLRSRSPPRGIKGGSRGSVCADFARGRCRRGSDCRFLHEENNEYVDRRHGSVPEENWENRHEKERSFGHPKNEERDYSRDNLPHRNDSQRSIRSTGICMSFLKGSCERGSSCRFIHEDTVVDSRGTSERVHDRDRKPIPGHDQRRDSYKMTIPCRFFALGKCRKGTECNFPHEGAGQEGPEGGSDRWGHRGPKWNDEATDSAHVPGRVASTTWGSDSGWNNKSTTWTGTADVVGGLEALPGDETWDRGLADEAKKWGDEKTNLVNGTNRGSDDTNHYNQFHSSTRNDKVSADIPGEKPMHQKSAEQVKSWDAPKWSNQATDSAHGSAETRSVNVTSGWNAQPSSVTWNEDAATDSVAIKPPSQWGNAEQMDNKGEIRATKWSDNALVLKETDTNNGVEIQNRATIDHNTATFSVPLPHIQEEMRNFTDTGARKEQFPHFTYGIQDPQSRPQEVSILSHEQTTTNATQAYPLPSPTLRNFDLNGPSEDAPNPNYQVLKTSGPPAPQNVVTSEQVAQISHISASLKQIFGNGQQLPQLYATLNSTNPMGVAHSAPPSAGLGPSIDGPFLQPNQNAWTPKQYDPVSSVMVTSQINIEPVKQNITADYGSQIPSQTENIGSLSVVGSAKNDNVESDKNGKAKQDGGQTNADDTHRTDEDGKKGKDKDTKGVRMFKFALVEFVKEILKPIWKEGQLSKEAHKTVVKKVVDKVTTTVPEDHIPQTQDKIDQYLAYSKNKLTKLVEAYVEKFSKV